LKESKGTIPADYYHYGVRFRILNGFYINSLNKNVLEKRLQNLMLIF